MIKGVLKEHATTIDYLSRSADPILAILCTQVLGHFNGFLGSPNFVWVLTICIPVFMVLIFPLFGIYKSWRGLPIRREIQSLFLAWLSVLLAFHVFTVLLSTERQFEVLWPFGIFKHRGFLIWAGTVFGVIAFFRILVRLSLRSLRKRGYNVRWVVIAGAGELGKQVNSTFLSNPWLGYVTKAFFDDDTRKQGRVIDGVPVAGSIDDLPAYVQERGIDGTFVALPLKGEERIRGLLQGLKEYTGDVNMVPDLLNYYLLNCSFGEIAGLPVLNLRRGLRCLEAFLKWCEDKVVAIALLVILSPVLLVIALAVMVSSRGPIIFRQRRYGMNGEEFVVYKFRTMTVCEDGLVIEQAKPCDPRLTRIGSFLRRYNLDELPQLINVFQGNMSVVGPRPHAVAHNEYYRKLVEHYMLRHKVKPGMTGLAQVNGWRGETDTLEKMERRVQYDLAYINNWSIWLDLRILMLTPFKVFGQPNAY